MSNPTHLVTQYEIPNHLEARIALHAKYRTNPVHLWDWLWEKYQFATGDRVLEVGCGTGDFWKHNALKVPKFSRRSLCDLSGALLEKCRSQIAASSTARNQASNEASNLDNFIQANAEELPLENKAFNKTLCHFMLYHVHNKDRACQELLRVTQPGGAIGIVTNSQVHMQALDDLAAQISSDFPQDPSRGSHSFSEENALDLLNRHFEKIEKHVYEDVLRVTSARDATNYLGSIVPDLADQLGAAFFREFEAQVERRIESLGSFNVQKRSVLFLLH